MASLPSDYSFSTLGAFGDYAGISNPVNVYVSALNRDKTSYPDVPSIFEKDSIVYTVVSMSGCYYLCRELEETPSLPNTVINLNNCFESCKSLKTPPSIPNGVKYMNKCFYNSGIREAPTIPDSVKDIGYFITGTSYWVTIQNKIYTLNDISLEDRINYLHEGLENIDGLFYQLSEDEKLIDPPKLPSTIKSMRDCFNGCSFMRSIPIIPQSVTSLNGTFKWCDSIPSSQLKTLLREGLTDISYLFYEKKDLVSPPKIPSTVEYMVSTFERCSFLTTAPTIPRSVVSLENAFKECELLVTVPSIPDSVENLSGCFSGCNRIPLSALNSLIKNGIRSIRNFYKGRVDLINPSQLPVFPNSITDMEGCFRDCINLMISPTIPNSVTDMGHCFYDCVNLTTPPMIPNSVTDMDGCFCGCESLITPPTIPNSVTSINYCFEGCDNLTTPPTIPNSVTDMYRCFKGCINLTTPSMIPNSVIRMWSCFEGCVNLTTPPAIPNGVDDMSSCFSGCINLTTPPMIPNSVYDMSYCFKGCESLTTPPAIPNGVDDMSSCFSGCINLTTPPTIPNSVTDMYNCFDGCINLTTPPTIPNSVTDMGYCFDGCTGLTSAQIASCLNNGVVNISGYFINRNDLIDPPIIPDSVTNMWNCFRDCINLTKPPTIPNSVTDMGHCFDGCESLTTPPTIPNSVTDMDYCFRDCINLTTPPTIPNSVTDMTYCFDECTGLTSVQIASCLTNGVIDITGYFSNRNDLIDPPIIPDSVTDMRYCFDGCVNLIDPPVVPYKVERLDYCFYGCESLTKGPLIPTTVTNMSNCFRYCFSLVTPPPIIQPNVTSIYRCFQNCSKMETAPEMKVGKLENMSETFKGCSSLVEVNLIPPTVTDIRDCFKGCESLSGYISFMANPEEGYYDGMFDGTIKEIRLWVSDKESNYQTTLNVASKWNNVMVTNALDLFPPPTITSLVCKRVGDVGRITEDREGDWVYYRLKFKMFVDFLPVGYEVDEPPIPSVETYVNNSLVYSNWLNHSSTTNPLIDLTGGNDDSYDSGLRYGAKPDYYEQTISGWFKFIDPKGSYTIGFKVKGYYDTASEYVYKTVTSKFKVLDIKAPDESKGDIYSKSTFSMGIGTLATRDSTLSIGVRMFFEDDVVIQTGKSLSAGAINTGAINAETIDTETINATESSFNCNTDTKKWIVKSREDDALGLYYVEGSNSKFHVRIKASSSVGYYYNNIVLNSTITNISTGNLESPVASDWGTYSVLTPGSLAFDTSNSGDYSRTDISRGKIDITDSTSNVVSYDMIGPKIEFSNADMSQNGRLVFTDYDSVNSGATLAWITDQTQSWFQAPYIRASTQLKIGSATIDESGLAGLVKSITRSNNNIVATKFNNTTQSVTAMNTNMANGAWNSDGYTGDSSRMFYLSGTVANSANTTRNGHNVSIYFGNGGIWAWDSTNSTTPWNLSNAVVGASVSGTTITFTRNSGSTFNVTTQDTNTAKISGATTIQQVATSSSVASKSYAAVTISSENSGGNVGSGTITGLLEFYTANPGKFIIGNLIYTDNKTSKLTIWNQTSSAASTTVTSRYRTVTVST